MRAPRRSIELALLSVSLLSACESKQSEHSTRPALPQGTPKADASRTARQQQQQQAQATQPAVQARTPEAELLAHPPRPPISIVKAPSASSPGRPERPAVAETRATGGGLLQRSGSCLTLESGPESVGLVFRNESARFDEASEELVVSGVRVKIGAPMFVRAAFWGGSSFQGLLLNPPLGGECTSKTYWLVDSIGEGPPNAQDLDCEGDVQGERTFRLEQEKLELRGGLAEQEAQTVRTWRQRFGIVRVCAEKHLPKKIGTLLDERIEVDISKNGLIHAMRFPEGRHADLVECMQGYSSQLPSFATAQRESLLTVQLTIRWGNSDYQIDGCDRLRKSE